MKHWLKHTRVVRRLWLSSVVIALLLPAIFIFSLRDGFDSTRHHKTAKTTATTTTNAATTTTPTKTPTKTTTKTTTAAPSRGSSTVTDPVGTALGMSVPGPPGQQAA